MSIAPESPGEGTVRVGILGADIVHALQYASVIRPARDSHAAMLSVPPLDPRMERRIAPLRCPAAAEPASLYTRADIENDPSFDGVDVVGWWGEKRADAEAMARTLDVDHMYATVEQMVDDVDAAMICTYEGSDHRRLALPFLQVGIPTFVDKPFATDVAAARAMVQTAQESHGVLFSSSPWKWSPAVQDLARRLPELGEVRTVVVTGPGINGPFFYITHLVETAYYLLGSGVERVSCVSDAEHHLITCRYSDGRLLVVNALRRVDWLRHIVVYGEHGYLEADISNAHRDEGQVRTVIEFVHAIRHGRSPLPLDHLVEMTAVMVGAEQSARAHGDVVWLRDLLTPMNSRSG